VAQHEDEKEADTATQKVQDNDFVVDVTKDEYEKEADPAMQKVQDNGFVAGADPGNTNIVTIAAPRRAEDGTDGSLRQEDMRLLRFPRARYYRESGVMNARKKIPAWDAGMKDHLEALSEVTSRGAHFQASRKVMEVRVAHWEALWEEYTKPRWARLRMSLYGGRQRVLANFFNELNALKEDESQRLVVAYGSGRWKTQKRCTPAPTTRTYIECARRFVTISIDEFRTSYTHHELGCTLQSVEIEKCQSSPEGIAKYGPLTEAQMERRAKVRGLLALVSTTNDGKERMEFVNRDFNAAIKIRRCAVLESRPPELPRENVIGQPPKVELFEKKLEAVAGGRSKKAGRRLHLSWRRRLGRIVRRYCTPPSFDFQTAVRAGPVAVKSPVFVAVRPPRAPWYLICRCIFRVYESIINCDMSSGPQDTSSAQSALKDTEKKAGGALDSAKESVTGAFSSAKETISDKFRDLTGQKSAQEKAQDKAGDAVDHLKETGQSAKKGIEHAADATKEKFQGN